MFTRIIQLLILVCAFTFISCTKNSDKVSKVDNDVIRIGEFGSMTGPESTFGLSTHKGIMMAIQEANDAGGVKGKKLEIVSYDNQGRSDEAVTAVTKLITQDNVKLLLGEVASSRSIAAAPIAQEYKVPMLSPSSTNPRVTQIGDYIFRVCFIDPFQGSVMAKFAKNHLKAGRAAILRDIKSDYSVGLANFFKKEFESMGGKIVADTSYSSGDMEFRSQLTKIKASNPEILFIPGYYTEVGLIARQARELKFKGALLGGDGWDSEKLAEIGGKAIVGGYFSSHYSPKDKNPVVQNFVDKFKSKYGEVPNALSAMGYDAARVAIDAINRAPDLDSKNIRVALASTKEFKGVTGSITINSNRNAVKPAVVLKVLGPNDYDFVTSVNP